MVDVETLRALLDRGDGRDRAFVDAMIRMGWSRARDPQERAELGRLHSAVRTASLRSHASLRARIAAGALRGAALRRHFDDVPSSERDHFVEEVLGIAYPPLDEPELGPELVAYAPSGYDEIVHALDVTRLGPDARFLDIGSGMGKAVMLAALLTGATSSGVECNEALSDLAEHAARELGLPGIRFTRGDARDVTFEDSDVVFMYLPFTGGALATVMDRLRRRGRCESAGSRPRFLCAAPLDLHRYDDLVAAGPPSSWLQVYTWRRRPGT
jgi:protein-L-isoaspartate O-methyltransferase